MTPTLPRPETIAVLAALLRAEPEGSMEHQALGAILDVVIWRWRAFDTALPIAGLPAVRGDDAPDILLGYLSALLHVLVYLHRDDPSAAQRLLQWATWAGVDQ